MLIISQKRFEWRSGRRAVGAGISLLVTSGILSVVCAVAAQAAVIEFFNPDLNNYFITADPVEQDMIDTGAVGRWERTGDAFATGGPNQVCRFYGNANINPATGTFYGPNSHFYTADATECAGLKAQYTPSAKSWKFESNDFLTTPAVNGACPAGLVPVYRAYNNGFAKGIDSNHRITSDYAAYQQTVAAGSIGEGVVMCAPAGPPPIATAVGVAVGSAASAIIGAAGGSLGAPDGRLVLTIPAGALAADTSISIQPFTNTAPGKIGAAYQLTPEGQTFLKPITLTFKYTDQDLLGTAAEFLGAAFQTAEGYWQWIGDATLDTAAKTMSVAMNHFTVVAPVPEVQMQPTTKTVKTNGSVNLQVVACFESVLAPLVNTMLGIDCTDIVPLQRAGVRSVNEWSVNSRLGGGGVFGTVSGHGTTANYTAPATAPIPPTVAVSARVHNRGWRTLVVSNITIAEDSWTGTGSSTWAIDDATYSTTADVTWTLDKTSANANGTRVEEYRASGTTTFNLSKCTIEPSSNPMLPFGGGFPYTTASLFIDYSTTPPNYYGNGTSLWIATFTCPPFAPATAGVTASFFGGSGPSGAQGLVSSDGTTIEGSDTNAAGVTFRWRFTRDP